MNCFIQCSECVNVIYGVSLATNWHFLCPQLMIWLTSPLCTGIVVIGTPTNENTDAEFGYMRYIVMKMMIAIAINPLR